MRTIANYRVALFILSLAPMLLTACEDEPLGPRAAGPALVPSFGLGPGTTLTVPEDLSPYLGVNSVAFSINNLKRITGWRTTSKADKQAFVWSAGASPTDLGTLGQVPYTSIGYDINDAGQVAGEASGHAVRWNSSVTPEQLAELAGGTSRAVAVNSVGYFAGTITSAGYVSYPVIWDASGQYQALTLGAQYEHHALLGTAEDLNDLREVVGTNADNRAYYYQGSIYRELALLPGKSSSSASGINQTGVIVGESGFRAVRWPTEFSPAQDLGTLGGDVSVAHDVNDAGVIVGAAKDGKGVLRPFRLPPSGYMEALPVPLGATYGLARGINQDGHMVGLASFSNNETHAMVWWRHTNILPAAHDWQTRTLSRLAPTTINIALLSVGKQSAAAVVEARTLTLGDNVGWDVKVASNADGTPAVKQADLNKDGLIDLLVSFDGREVLRSETGRNLGDVELLLKGVTKDRSAALYATGIINIQR